MTIYAFTDGASRGNPGESGIGVVVKDEKGDILLSEYGYIGIATNNIAEYSALIALLKRIKKLPHTRLIVHSDSELMVRQINGEYKVKDENIRKYYQKVLKLVDGESHQFEVKHIPRSENSEADRLANKGIESRKKIRI
jgi:ribonuclease HI